MITFNASIRFDNGPSLNIVLDTPSVFRVTDLTPRLADTEAQLEVLKRFYRSRFGHDFDFTILAKE